LPGHFLKQCSLVAYSGHREQPDRSMVNAPIGIMNEVERRWTDAASDGGLAALACQPASYRL
jgi:hypothetical protein